MGGVTLPHRIPWESSRQGISRAKLMTALLSLQNKVLSSPSMVLQHLRSLHKPKTNRA